MSKDHKEYQIDKDWIRNSFSNAAESYDSVAVLQKEVANRLIERLDFIKVDASNLLDIGSGTGYCSELLCKKFSNLPIYALDIAHGMVKFARDKKSFFKKLRSQTKYVCGDVENLPIRSDSIDLAVSSLTLQWCFNLDLAFEEVRRVIKSDGLFIFATLGPDTLKELRHCWAQVDDSPHVSAFIDMHDIGDALHRAGFSAPVMDVETITLTYSSVKDIMLDLKRLGSRNALSGRARGLTGKKKMQDVMTSYESYKKDGFFPATYEIVYGHAWVGMETKIHQNEKEFPIPVKVID